MNTLYIILPIILLISLILDYLYMMKKDNSFEIVRKMGIGYNLGNTFDSFSFYGNIEAPDEQIELNGNIAPTKDIIKKIKKYGFKTIRFPVTWMHFIDDEGNIKQEWMIRVKEVVDIIIEEKVYCILNVQNDGYYLNWLAMGMKAKDKYINLWTQIAHEFKDYNEYLIFESMDEIYFFGNGSFDFSTLIYLNQAFVDTIRNSRGNNIERLLLVTGAFGELQMTCSSDYKMPVDKSNKLALSLHYYAPYDFVSNHYFEPYNFTDYNGNIYKVSPILRWGSSSEYNQMIEDFELMKSHFVDKGIPVIFNEVGMLTEEKKEMKSIREYLYLLFSLASDYDGIMCCLWDTSNKIFGERNFYDRTNDIWYDEKIKNNFLRISKGKYIKPKDYFIYTTFESTDISYYIEKYIIDFENRKVLEIIINARLTGVLFADFSLIIYTFSKDGFLINIPFGKENLKKQYDGTYIFKIDVSKIDCYESIHVEVTRGSEYFSSVNLTLKYEESFPSIDYKSYKNAISNYI